jgi:hypothetical protein
MALGGKPKQKELQTQSYLLQKESIWPEEGRHILAQYDEDSVVVYQAYCPEIAKYAVEHQKFGGDKFSYKRMSWIKTNFLWMMYRCGWASKKDQEHVLAVWIKREGFEEILRNALTGRDEKERGMKAGGDRAQVRLQWDPDHTPHGDSERRRAIQLGLRDEILMKYGNEWIVQIKDITSFVKEQYTFVKENELEKLTVAEERVYEVKDELVCKQIGVD